MFISPRKLLAATHKAAGSEVSRWFSPGSAVGGGVGFPAMILQHPDDSPLQWNPSKSKRTHTNTQY